MTENTPFVNKVAAAGLLTLDLETFLPKAPIAFFDLKDHLFMGLILKEKDFREALKAKDWNEWAGKYVAVGCSVDAIIPVWAYMLVASYLQPVAREVFVGSETELYKHIVLNNIQAVNAADYEDQRVVVKGCGDVAIEPYAYAAITQKLLPLAKSVMYGEPCSTVPVYKKKASPNPSEGGGSQAS
ncbi:DUF2480 family protein [Flaviaesturariibacter aridisoli]|uniref:DUF2480 family protein n=1 Tax=Flaviaesturariibacter aridisoli TaxID=2545761 RepID=A0A4R4E277_9BACT|nr:DUF2480 family protein [Flaviaesturariibacter aridisoli]TCZ70483.1 DUF2480 family protein [Flaviaesturariibacter aridisoli]